MKRNVVGRKRLEFCNQCENVGFPGLFCMKLHQTDVSAKGLEILAHKFLTSEDYTN
jgi:hypothetical protein